MVGNGVPGGSHFDHETRKPPGIVDREKSVKRMVDKRTSRLVHFKILPASSRELSGFALSLLETTLKKWRNPESPRVSKNLAIFRGLFYDVTVAPIIQVFTENSVKEVLGCPRKLVNG